MMRTDMGTLVPVIFLLFVMFSALNIYFLHLRFKKFNKLKTDPGNLYALKKFKRKWSLIYFTDFLFFIPIFISVYYLITHNAFFLSFIITFFYMVLLGNIIEKSGKNVFGSIKNENIARPENIRYKINGKKNINTAPYDQENRNSTATGETRKLTINRVRAFTGWIINLSIFIETDDVSDDNKIITINDRHYKQAGIIPNGKTLNANILTNSVDILIANSLRVLARFTISSGNDDVIYNFKVRQYNFEIERIK